jgi:beta-xylosidase
VHVSRTRAAGLAVMVVSAIAALAGVAGPVAPASAAPGSDRFWAGLPYAGEFGAPSIIREGSTYYAYATNLDGNNLPLMTSTDLETWNARAAWPLESGYSGWAGYNDAMPTPAAWAAKLPPNGKPGVWAPAVAKLGGLYVDAYAVQTLAGSNRHCLSLATSSLPTGPFVDTSSGPLYCSSDPMGSIDPAWLRHRGRVYLVWKNAGVPGSKPTEVLAQEMTPDGLPFAPGTRPTVLLATADGWEGNVIEAPSPIAVGGRIYLFYSGNRYSTATYAIGYARCRTPLGPCTRVRSTPLIESDGYVAGPGAQTPFVDHTGRLRLAYSAWRSGRVGYQDPATCRYAAGGCNQRRMYVATLKVRGDGTLKVTKRY